MNIELKYRINYHLTTVIIAIAALFFGITGVLARIDGILFLPFTSALIACLFCIEKKKILSVIIPLVLVAVEIYVGITSYFLISSLSSIVLAIVIYACFIKGVSKSDAALISLLIVVLSIVLSVILYMCGTMADVGLGNVIERIVEATENTKQKMISYMLEIYDTVGSAEESFSQKELEEIFDVYLDCLVAFVTIFAFLITGITYKIFSKIVLSLTKDIDKVQQWHFVPSSAFAYFYFAIAILSIFTSNTESALDISVMNLYLIFMFIFAYVGYKYVSTVIKKSGRNSVFTSFAIIAMILIFSSFAIQILAVCGAFVSIKHARLTDSTNK